MVWNWLAMAVVFTVLAFCFFVACTHEGSVDVVQPPPWF